jgi:hypothetical protein
MKLIRMAKVIFFKKRKNNFLFNNQPIHYIKCFSIGSCKKSPYAYQIVLTSTKKKSIIYWLGIPIK